MTYNTNALLAGLAALIAGCIGVVLLMSVFISDETPEQLENSGSAPIVDIQGTTDARQPTAQNTATPLSLATFTKSTMQVRNFISDPDVVVLGDRVGTTYYSLGSVPDESLASVVSGATSSVSSKARGYELLYFPDGTLAVRILHEPIAELRRAAMDDLVKRLAISSADLCSLLVSVRVDAEGVLAGKYIGFPGCTGGRILAGDTTN